MRTRADGCARRSSSTCAPGIPSSGLKSSVRPPCVHTERMVLLILFAFVAGVGTALSPCVLPVLPIALSAGATGGSRRPLGIVPGLAVSFTFVAVALVYVIHALGLPNDLLRNIA